MTLAELARQLFDGYEKHALGAITPFECKHADLQAAIKPLLSPRGTPLTAHDIGQSIEGRTIKSISFGQGENRILVWSQMHGDEPTGTLALLDVLHCLAKTGKKEPWVQEMLGEVSVECVPMLNPDGAERVQRQTAASIDLNRDALVFATPEARVLRNIHQQFRPEFALHLHDQELSSVGSNPVPVVIALLAPPMDEGCSLTSTRLRAMSVGAMVVDALSLFVKDHIATYDDTFEPRAFGDAMQSWGTSTLLIESGHWVDDPEKTFVRKLNFVAILCALYGIGKNDYQTAVLDHYTTLHRNGKRVFDIVLRGVVLEHSSGWSHRADLGLMVDPPFKPRPKEGRPGDVKVVVKEIGDLSTHSGLTVIEAHDKKLAAEFLAVEKVMPMSDLLAALESPGGA
ncbi:MAG: M14 family zinc carboxypeptidase [Bacteroidota bacterium]